MTYEEKLKKADTIKEAANKEAKQTIELYNEDYLTIAELAEVLQDIHKKEVAALKALNEQND